MKTSSKSYLLGIDQGSSGSRALVMNRNGDVCGYGYRALTRLYPQTGWAEQDPTAVVEGVTEAVMEAIVQAGCGPDDLIACGIAGQRNTDFVWDARTNRPLANAITWQSFDPPSAGGSGTAEPDPRDEPAVERLKTLLAGDVGRS